MKMFQKTIEISSKKRGFYLITDEVIKQFEELRDFEVGMCQIFIQHTSASLTINENADPTVRQDFEAHFNKMVPENAPYYKHTYEGADDMPAHIKASLLGPSVQIPVRNGQFAFGTWQGVYLCEHRNYGGPRKLVISCWGQ